MDRRNVFRNYDVSDVVKQRLFKNNYRLLFLFHDDYNNFFSLL